MIAIEGALVASNSAWRIPPYAQTMLWVQQGAHAAQAHGERGVFALSARGDSTDASREPLTLAWGAPGGPPLAIWPAPETAPFVGGWQGAAHIGGFVERLHVLEAHDLELVIAEIEGALLPPDYPRLPGLEQMRAAPFRRLPEPDLPAGARHTYFVLAPVESALADYLHHAMVSELAVNCRAALGPQAGEWHALVGLPLLLDSLTLLAPGYRARLG